ncbi:helix-turn-helix transcriptional regulator [Saccharopolyspora sp. SCSIO 74807]|uniref:helix-turn-helix domain-containing protein n=1 Tax=Saccharopolyspora sp. SCSIO 74807 TaxID=3118084 RepID=UPI0030D04752
MIIGPRIGAAIGAARRNGINMNRTAGTPRARALSAALRETRRASGVGLRALSRQLELSHTQLSHWENGSRVPSIETVAMILAALRVPSGDRERILDLARNTAEPNWLTVGLAGIPQQLAGAIESERAASAISQWSPLMIPGLLQTPDFIKATMQELRLPQPEEDVRNMARIGRSEVLTRENALKFEAIVSEAVLQQPMADPSIMAEQFSHLISMSARPNIHIKIVPLRTGWHPGLLGPFTLYDFPEAPSVVSFEHYSSGAFVPTDHDVRQHREALARIRNLAFDKSDSLECIRQAHRTWESQK